MPEAITEGDTREEALLRAEDALGAALAMYIAAKEPLPTSSQAKAGEELVPLSALGMAKTALYDAMCEQGVGRAELARRYAGICPKSVVCSICVMLPVWNTWKPHLRRWVCV